MPSGVRELVLGIDFGTSYSSAAVHIDGRVHFALDAGDASIPTMVYVPASGPLVVGKDALRLGFSDPFNVVTSIKRLLGLSFADPALRALDASSHYTLFQGPGGQVLLRLRNQELAPVQLASAVIARLRKLAETRFGGVAKRAVFTVPAERSAGYTPALTLAARLAGLEVLDVVPEPIAGFAAEGLDREGDRRVAVVDFGGGTFDATLMEQRGLKFSMRAIGGDAFLGGDDFDHILADAVDGSMAKLRRPLRNDQVKWRQLLWRCESVKRQLSTAGTVRLQLKDRLSPSSDLDLVIERSWIEPRWQPLVDRAVGVVQALLAHAGWQSKDVDEIAMIGGTTLIPLVSGNFSRLFGRKVAGAPEATLAVARGAALLGARHAERAAFRVASAV